MQASAVPFGDAAAGELRTRGLADALLDVLLELRLHEAVETVEGAGLEGANEPARVRPGIEQTNSDRAGGDPNSGRPIDPCRTQIESKKTAG